MNFYLILVSPYSYCLSTQSFGIFDKKGERCQKGERCNKGEEMLKRGEMFILNEEKVNFDKVLVIK